MNNTSNWTGRVHRTSQSAFGPYASGPIEDNEPPYHFADLWVMAVCLVGLVVVLVVL